MKTTRPLIAVAVLSLLAILACASFGQSTPAPVAVSPGDSFALKEGGTALLGDSGVELTFVRVIEDQRCPSDYECAEAGGMSIEVELAQGDQIVPFELRYWLGDDPPIAELGGVRVQFTDLEPYPRELGRASGPYAAAFQMLDTNSGQAPDAPSGPDTTEDPLTVIPGEPFTLTEGQTAALADTGVDLTFTQMVEDWRCPLSDDCAEAGGMTIRIELTGDNQSEQFEFRYSLGMPLPTAEMQGVTVQFVDLSPYPEGFDPPDEPYVATFLLLDAAAEPTPDVPGTSFQIFEGATYTLGGSGVTMTFIDVLEDARCPTDHECEVAGWVVLRVEFSDGSQSEVIDILYYLGDAFPVVEWQGVTVQYLGLEPYPDSSDPITETYIATFAYTLP